MVVEDPSARLTGASPIRRHVLATELYETLKEQVMDLRIPPGARLNIDKLAREFGVSSTPVRESLARLESEGLLSRRALYGYYTTPLLDKVSLTELMEVRLVLEPAAARAAAGAIGTRSLELLQHSVDEMTEGSFRVAPSPTYKSYQEFASQDALFHDTIAMESGNGLLRSLLSGLHTHLHLYRLYFAKDIAPAAAHEHAAILAALRERDGKKAASAMSTHVSQSLKRLLPMVSGGPTGAAVGTEAGPGVAVT